METLTKLNWEIFAPKFGEWSRYFEPLFRDTNVMENIYAQLKAEGREGVKICPDSVNTFNSFLYTSPASLKVIFVLLDPYPSIKNGIKVASGIGMDCENTGVLQPSLEKFYDAIERSEAEGFDLHMLKPASLRYLCEQGVMFFNTALTVPEKKTGAHTELWAPFMKYFYENVMGQFSGMIYVLSGKESQQMKYHITPLSNYIINLEHPSFAARQYRDWNYDGVFKKINYILKNNNGPESVINWVLEEAPF